MQGCRARQVGLVWARSRFASLFNCSAAVVIPTPVANRITKRERSDEACSLIKENSQEEPSAPNTLNVAAPPLQGELSEPLSPKPFQDFRARGLQARIPLLAAVLLFVPTLFLAQLPGCMSS